ncbi:MAG TPA: 2-enoate reductase, partial [Candidatus Scatomorpha merdipullorum]|nr:2-enoate reductase [Candidatus Scatomorpha merdipullorum]
MDEKYSALFTPWKIGNVEIKNRIVMCSMGGTSLFGWMEPCHFDKEAAYFLLQTARDDVGLILPGMQWVRDVMGNRWLYTNKRMFGELKEYMQDFHKTGAKLFIQLAAGCGRSMGVNHLMSMMLDHPAMGKVGKFVMDAEYLCASASPTPNRWKQDYKSRPLTVAEIKESTEAFGKTARLLREAGVDGVEIHAVHEGYT